MKPRLLIFSSLLAIAIVAGVATSDAPTLRVALYTPDKLSAAEIVTLSNVIARNFHENGTARVITVSSPADIAAITETPDLVVASAYPSVLFAQRYNGLKAILESNQNGTSIILGNPSLGVNNLSDLVGRTVAVGPNNDTFSYFLSFIVLAEQAATRMLPNKLGMKTPPNTIGVISAESASDAQTLFDLDRVPAVAVVGEPAEADSSTSKELHRETVPEINVLVNQSTLSAEQIIQLKQLLGSYPETGDPESTITPSVSRTDAQTSLSKLELSLNVIDTKKGDSSFYTLQKRFNNISGQFH